MEKIEEAIKKINTEIQKKPNDEYIALIGEHIIDQIVTDEAADAVLQKEKTLTGALEEIFRKAKVKASGNRTAIRSEVVYGWAREYFGLKEAKKTEAANPQTAAEKETNHLSLDDFF